MVNGNGISESEIEIIRVWPDQRKCYPGVVKCPWAKCYAHMQPSRLKSNPIVYSMRHSPLII